MSEDYYKTLIKDIIENNDKEEAIKIIANKLNEKQISNEKEILTNLDKDKKIERLNNIINKGIEAINLYQDEKTLSVGYQDLKRIRGILQGNEFDLQMFEEYLQELKGGNKE